MKNVVLSSLSNKINKILTDNEQLSQLDRSMLIDLTKRFYDELLNLEIQTVKSDKPLAVEVETKMTKFVEETAPVIEQKLDEEYENIESQATQMKDEPIKDEPQSKERIVFDFDALNQVKAIEKQDRTRVEIAKPIREKLISNVEDEKRDFENENVIADSRREPLLRDGVSSAAPSSSNGNGHVSYQISQSDVAEMNKEISGMFEIQSGNELSDRLANQRVSDIKQALSINDRILYSKVLFQDDDEYNRTIYDLNGMSTLDEAKNYLFRIIEKNDWTSENKEKIAQDFIKVISRRYM